MEITPEDINRANDIVAQGIGFKIDPSNLPRLRFSTNLRLLLTLATRRGRECAKRGIACAMPRGIESDPSIQLIALWNYTVATKTENLKLARG
jgi:hypothetical protein